MVDGWMARLSCVACFNFVHEAGALLPSLELRGVIPVLARRLDLLLLSERWRSPVGESHVIERPTQEILCRHAAFQHLENPLTCSLVNVNGAMIRDSPAENSATASSCIEFLILVKLWLFDTARRLQDPAYVEP